ncbi:MAG: SDR family NAD(P)-dependent oxidoreductase [Marinifilaceae bacterium]
MKKFGLITGAASGIGYEIAKLLIQDSYHLVLIDKNATKLQEIQSDFKSQYKNEVQILEKDLSKTNVADEIYDELRQQQIELDLLVNNAGYGVFGMFSETDWKRERDMIQLHVITSTHLTKLFLPGMVRRGTGKILNVSSLAAFQPGPLMSIYYATKAYLLSFTEAIANEVKGTGVTITVLCPGITKTGFQKTVSEEEAQINWNLASAANVARYGYKAMLKGKIVAIPGFINYLLANAPRFFPRRIAANVVRRLQERNRKKSPKKSWWKSQSGEKSISEGSN